MDGSEILGWPAGFTPEQLPVFGAAAGSPPGREDAEILGVFRGGARQSAARGAGETGPFFLRGPLGRAASSMVTPEMFDERSNATDSPLESPQEKSLFLGVYT